MIKAEAEKRLAEIRHNIYEGSPEMALVVWACEVKGADCAGYFLQDGFELKAVCWSCREDLAHVWLEAELAELRADGFDTFRLERCEQGGEACLFFVLTEPGDKDAVCEGCRDERASYGPLPYPEEHGVRWVLAGMVEVLEKAASNLGRRTARALVSRFGEKDGYDFYSEVKLCGECNGLSKDYFTDVNCVPCRGKGVRVRHFTLQRTQLGRSVVRGKPVELTGKVWQVERSAQEVLLRLPEECR